MARKILLVVRIALAAVFIYAAYTKLKQPWLLFALSIDSYQLLPDWAVLKIARVLPWTELAIGILLLTGIGLRWVAAGATALLGVFFGVMIAMYAKGRGIDCGCFGVGEALSAKTLARDGLLVLASIGVLVSAWRRPKAGSLAGVVAGPHEVN